MDVFTESQNNMDSISSLDSSTINNERLDSDCEDEEPLATEQESAEYQQQVDEELEQQQMLQDGFDRKTELRSWCHCSQCSVELVTKPEECFCCTEIDRCKEILEELDIDECCITSHPGFRSVCLDEWVLQIAAIGLQTRRKKRYTVLFDMESLTRHGFFDLYHTVSLLDLFGNIWDTQSDCHCHAVRIMLSEESSPLRMASIKGTRKLRMKKIKNLIILRTPQMMRAM